MTHFYNIRKIESPRTAFLTYLADEIETWKTKGDQIILMGDINEYILRKIIGNFIAKIGLQELITERHGSLVPVTTRENKKEEEIYVIWGSQGITISQGIYLTYHFGTKSDHRLLWIKILHLVAFGEPPPPPKITCNKKTKTSSPKGSKNYIMKIRLLNRMVPLL